MKGARGGERVREGGARRGVVVGAGDARVRALCRERGFSIRLAMRGVSSVVCVGAIEAVGLAGSEYVREICVEGLGFRVWGLGFGVMFSVIMV